MVAEHAAGKAGEDWSQGGQTRAVCHLPNGRGGCAKGLVPENPEPDRRSVTKTRSGVGRGNRRRGENDTRGVSGWREK